MSSTRLRICWLPLSVVCLVLLATLPSGCVRSRYRERADNDAYHLITEKSNNPHWPLERYWIDVDPRSRMFNPFNPDHPPMPPDDPTSHELMHFIDGKKGYPHWHVNGDTPFVESPGWFETLPLDENGVLNLTATEAYQLALVHSTSYQEEYEDLYLSALDVSAERFRFDTQFFAGYSSFYETSGPLRNQNNSGNLRNGLEVATSTDETGRLGLPAGGVRAPNQGNLLLRKSFITGADLAVGLANSIMWDFHNGESQSAFSIVDVSLVQPLLRSAGRDRILEQLTIAERALLANVRQMERFRRAFYVELMTGLDAGDGASRRGGFFGGSGLEGFSGVGGGGFGTIGGGGFGGGDGGFGGGGAGAGEVNGFLGLLQDLQDIRNQQVTIVGLRSNLAQLRESLNESLTKIPDDSETILRERLQIAQSRQALLNAESRLLNAQNGYQASLDFFKARMGLPPYLCMNVIDPMIDQFNLIEPNVLASQDQISQLRDRVARINEQLIVASQRGDAANPSIPADQAFRIRVRQLKDAVTETRRILEEVRQTYLLRTREDIERLRAALPERSQGLGQLSEKYTGMADRFEEYGNLDPCQELLVADIDPSVFDRNRLEAVPEELLTATNRLAAQFDSYDQPLVMIEEQLTLLLESPSQDPLDYETLERSIVFAIPGTLADLSEDILDLSLVQARARTDTINLVPIELRWTEALEIARQFRRDWMNNRAALVDSWRLIEFNADNLESNLDLIFEGDIQNTQDNPIRFRDSNGQIRVGLRFDAPITRLQERNTYRQSLIEYQQARRSYYRSVDSITRGLRSTLRTIDVNRVNFEERRVAVLSAIDQVVLNDQIRKLREEQGLEAGVTAARDVVSALADFQSAQNDFLSVWLNYEAQRMILDLNLGTMSLDTESNWIDPGPVGGEYGYPQAVSGDVPLLEMAPQILPELEPVEVPEDAGMVDPGAAIPGPDVRIPTTFETPANSAIAPAVRLAPDLGRPSRLPGRVPFPVTPINHVQPLRRLPVAPPSQANH